jgi:hypothetical protein
MELDLGDVEIGGFLKSGIVYKCSPNQLLPCNHITRYGTGLVWSLFALVRGASQLYKGLQDPGIRVDAKRRSTHITAYPEPPEDTWVLPPWRRSYALEEVLPGRAGEVNSTG